MIGDFSGGADGIDNQGEDRDGDESDKAPPFHPNAKGGEGEAYED